MFGSSICDRGCTRIIHAVRHRARAVRTSPVRRWFDRLVSWITISNTARKRHEHVKCPACNLPAPCGEGRRHNVRGVHAECMQRRGPGVYKSMCATCAEASSAQVGRGGGRIPLSLLLPRGGHIYRRNSNHWEWMPSRRPGHRWRHYYGNCRFLGQRIALPRAPRGRSGLARGLRATADALFFAAAFSC